MKLRLSWTFLLVTVIAVLTVQIVAAQSSFSPGDKVIVAAQKLTVYDTASTSSAMVIDLLHGFVGQIGAAKTEGGETWVYLSDGARGWVEVGNPPALIPYSDAALAQIVQDASTSIASNPNDVDAYLTRASAESSQHNYDDALVDFGHAIDLSPQDGSLYYYRGLVYATSGDFGRAISDAMRAPTMGYKTALAYNLIGTIYSRQSQEDAARSYYEQAIQTDAAFGFPYLNLAKSYYLAQRFPDSLAMVQQALRADPNLAIAFSTQATIYETMGDPQSALKSYTAAITLAPFDAHGYIERSLFYSGSNNFAEAQKDLTQAIQLDPQSDRAYAGRGINDLKLGDIQSGIQDLEQAVALNPTNDDALFNLGSAYSMTGDNQKALDHYTQAIELSDHYNSGALLYRGQIYTTMANYDAALNDLNHYLGLADGEFAISGYITRASVYVSRTNFGLANSDLVTALSTETLFTFEYHDIGSGYRTGLTSDTDAMIATVAQQAAAAPNDSALQLQLAQVSIQYGVWKQAYQSLTRYAALTNTSDIGMTDLLNVLSQLSGVN